MSSELEKGTMPLSEAVDAVRAQLEIAIAEAAGEALVFDVTGVDLEFQVGLTATGTTGAKAKVFVLEFGADLEFSRARTQTVRFSLKPRWRATGDPPQASQVAIADEGAVGVARSLPSKHSMVDD